MTERTKLKVLAVLLFAACALYLYERVQGPGTPGVLSADTHFVPLNAQEPALRLDLLRNLLKDEYSGAQRNIFVTGPAPAAPGAQHVEAPHLFVGPTPPPPPPLLQVPVEFYGVEWRAGGKHLALFKSGEDIVPVSEGETFLNRYRLVHIGNQSADVEEISTGRHATLPLLQPDQSSSPSN